MSSSFVLPAVADGAYEVRRPYKPSRKGWGTASHVASAATLALMLAAGIDREARALRWPL